MGILPPRWRAYIQKGLNPVYRCHIASMPPFRHLPGWTCNHPFLLAVSRQAAVLPMYLKQSPKPVLFAMQAKSKDIADLPGACPLNIMSSPQTNPPFRDVKDLVQPNSFLKMHAVPNGASLALNDDPNQPKGSFLMRASLPSFLVPRSSSSPSFPS